MYHCCSHVILRSVFIKTSGTLVSSLCWVFQIKTILLRMNNPLCPIMGSPILPFWVSCKSGSLSDLDLTIPIATRDPHLGQRSRAGQGSRSSPGPLLRHIMTSWFVMMSFKSCFPHHFIYGKINLCQTHLLSSFLVTQHGRVGPSVA